MNFKNHDLKDVYDSDEDDILNDFYIPMISAAVRYDRLAGYFSSTILAMSAKGMADFIRNGGKMRMVTCLKITEQDRRAIEEGLANPEDAISRIMMTGLDLADQIQKDHVAALAWMIAQKKLDIKIAVPLADDGGFLTGDLDKNSVYHQKVGVFHDSDQNVVSFSGSVNETGKAWTDNIEEFKVFCSWKPGQDVYGSADARKFEKFWHGLAKNTKVFDLPTAVKERLMISAPKSMDEAVARVTESVTKPTLRDYQNDAVNKWLENNRHGIFEMATGTGKTHTAISCIQRICGRPERNLIVIACPYRHLITQWIEELKKWGMESVRADGSSSAWKHEVGSSIGHLNDGVVKNVIVVTTHATFSKKPFMNAMQIPRIRTFLVADEVHNLGTERNSDGLLDSYELRLGLSATPARYFDDEGTEKILDYFGGIVYRFDLDTAIREGYLTHYLLFPHVVYMTDDELGEYHNHSKKLAIEMSRDRPDRDRVLSLTINRSNILKTAKNKIGKFEEILAEGGSPDRCLVYCANGHQLSDAASILHKMHVIFHRFTMQENPKERKQLLAEFGDGTKDVLLAIKCLDEGADVPSTRTAILLASSRNPIEFIQRRGRILRIHPGKERAVIHDLIVLPKHPPGNEIYAEYEKSMMQKEFERLQEFANSSDNPEYSRELIQTFMSKYNSA